jgi:hypothetical protein
MEEMKMDRLDLYGIAILKFFGTLFIFFIFPINLGALCGINYISTQISPPDLRISMNILLLIAYLLGIFKMSLISAKEYIQQNCKKSRESDCLKKPTSDPVKEYLILFGFNGEDAITKRELKKRFFHQLKLHHPDKWSTGSDHEKMISEKKTKEIILAYEKLLKVDI